MIAAAVIGGGLAGAIIFDSGWRAILCVIATVTARIAITAAAAALAAPRLAGYATSVRDLERLREIYRAANADYIKAEKAVDSYLPKINNFR